MTGVSRQLDILRALALHLEGIEPDGNYDYDLRGRVFVGRLVFGASDVPPMLSIVESPRPDPFAVSETQTKLKRLERWEVFVQGWADDSDVAAPCDATYALKATVEQRLARIEQLKPQSSGGLYPDEYRLGGRIGSMQIGPGMVRPSDGQNVSRPFFFIPLILSVQFDLTDLFV